MLRLALSFFLLPSTLLPDGPIVVPIDDRLKTSLFSDPASIYQVRAVAECFSAAPIPHEWTFPVYASPEGTGKLGAITARVAPGTGMEFSYQPDGGKPMPFSPDWVEADWGYTFLMNQTDVPCNGDEPVRPLKRQNYLVDAAEFYDADLHLQLRVAYPKGC